MSDSLLHAIAAGRPDAIDECMRRHGGLVWSLARRGSPTPADAEDAVQEIWIALWRSAARYDPSRGAEATFVRTIAERRLIDRRRRRQRRPEMAMLEDVADPQAAASGAGAGAEIADEAARVRTALAGLRPEQRRVLEFNLVQGHTHQEIAARTGMPLGTVKSHARRGLERVRQMLGASGAGAAEAVEGAAEECVDPSAHDRGGGGEARA